MTTSIIDPYGNKNTGDDDSKIFKKIKDILSDLKSSGVSQNSRIENAIDKLTAVSVNGAQNAKSSVNSAIIKTTSISHTFLKTILFFITLIIGFIFFERIYDLTTKLSLAIGSSYFQTATLGWISLTLTGIIIINLLLFLFPFFQDETKSKIIKVESKILVFLILLLISFNVLGGESFVTNYNTEEKAQIVTENIDKSRVNLWDKIGCYITFNQECITEKLTTKTAENTVRSTYSLTFEKPPQQSKQLNQWQQRPITLNYKIASSGDLTIDRIECYQEKIDSEHLLSNITMNNRVVNTDGQITDLPGIFCNLEKLKVTGNKQTEDITIIPVLYMTINTVYTLKIPIISEKLYIEQTAEKGPIAYLDYKTIEYMKKNNKQFEVKQTNNALNFKVKGIENSFPLIYGNNDPLKFDIPIEISENPSNPLGKIENTQLIEKPTIPKYFIYDNKETEETFSKSSDGTKLYYNLYLTEEDNNVENIDLPIIVANIDLKTRSTLKKEDMGTRFKITVRDIQITTQNNNNVTQENINYNFDQLILKYNNIKQNIQTPYSEKIQYKINDIESLILIINPYNNRELTSDEIKIKNTYLYGLNQNILELETIAKKELKNEPTTVDSPMP